MKICNIFCVFMLQMQHLLHKIYFILKEEYFIILRKKFDLLITIRNGSDFYE